MTSTEASQPVSLVPPGRSRIGRAPLDFIQQHKVFRLEELRASYRATGRSEKYARDALKYHLKQGRIRLVRRGVYAHDDWVDPWLIATKLADPVVISHDGALSFHGVTGVGHGLTFMTTARASVARYQDIIFQPLRVAQRRLDWSLIEEHAREGQQVFVTSLEAGLVDCLESLSHAPPLEDLMDAFKRAKGRAQPRAMVDHALRSESPLLCARLGFFLTCADYHLDGERGRLRDGCSQRHMHFQRSHARQGDRYFAPWELIVPRELYACLPGESEALTAR